MTRPGPSPTDVAELTTAGVCVLAVAAAVATATSYVLQPELPAVARDVGSSLPVIGLVAALPIGGYLCGLALLVPLADRIRSNRLISGQLSVLAAGLLIAAIAATPLVLGAGLFVSGLCASTGAQMSSLAGRYSEPSRRGRAVGTVTAGISAGIVLGRILGGTLADWWGWRAMLLVFAAACLALALAAGAVLPRTAMRPTQSYLTVIRSLPGLLRSSRPLRTSAVAGSLWFFAFSLVWVGLSLVLARPPIDLSPARIGVYSLAGLLGVAATRVAGAAADRYAPRAVILSGLAAAAVGTLTMTGSLQLVPVLLAALAVFDAGLFSAQVANQSTVLGIDPERPAQFNGAYMVVYFMGGTVGTAAGGSLIDVAGWAGIGLTATAALTVAAGIVLLFGRTLAGAERGQEVAEGVEAVRADHGVAVGPGGGHPAHLGAVARGLGAGVGPDDPVGDPGQAGHLLAEQRGLAGFPAVRDDQDHRAAGHAAGAITVVELLDRGADPGPAGPVGCRLARLGQHGVRAGRGQGRGQPGQPGGEAEHLGPVLPAADLPAVQAVQEH
jgi:predicted MFS family arabinose efflux permease